MNKETILNKHLTYGEDTYLAGQRDNILAAMEEFAQSQNDGKPLFSGALPLDDSKLKQIFLNNFDCYTKGITDAGGITEPAMTVDRFIEVVKLVTVGNDR